MKTNITQARINQQIRNMLKQPLPYLTATPLQNDIYTWHFTIQGPQNSDFHQGLYHGQILLPFEYPFKPPDIVFTNKNGRFQTNTKICLTITQYHPEEWNSGWTVRTMLEAVISLFSENIQGIGYQQGSPQQRRSLAKRSHEFRCEKCGVLKDLLKPREPRVEKKEEEEEEEKVRFEEEKRMMGKENGEVGGVPVVGRMEYAKGLNGGRGRGEDGREDRISMTKNNQNKNNSSQSQTPSHLITPNTLPPPNLLLSSLQQPPSHQSIFPPNHQHSQKPHQPHLKTTQIDDDPIALDTKVHKNFISWGRVVKSQKWSVLE